MAVDQISKVIDRLGKDTSFRGEYRADPDRALSPYRLSGDEMRALKSGDGPELELMGLGHKWTEFVEALCGPHPGP
jgi:hypothetical protein